MVTITINQPDDWHVHLRDGLALKHTVAASSQHFARVLAMPNLKPALTSVDALSNYRQRILSYAPTNKIDFIPFMTLYLNEQVTAETLDACAQHSFVLGAKLYPAGATTNSAEGVRSLKSLYPLLEVMQDKNLVLQIHGEVTQGNIFEREKQFIKDYLQPLSDNFPRLRMVFEHISTRAAVEYVEQASAMISATITPHHLLYNCNQLLAGGVRPHYYCLPILKFEDDQRALQQAAISGNPKFFAGTDSAPHAKLDKETACGCAGIYSAPYAVAFYAQLFDDLNALTRLNGFLSEFGADFYQLPRNKGHLELIKQPQKVPLSLPFGEQEVIPMAAGETLPWSINEQV